MAHYSSVFRGYKIIIEPKTKTHPGRIAQFVNGRYETVDPRDIAKLDAICIRNPTEMQRIDQSIEVIDRIRKQFQDDEKIVIGSQQESPVKKISQKSKKQKGRQLPNPPKKDFPAMQEKPVKSESDLQAESESGVVMNKEARDNFLL